MNRFKKEEKKKREEARRGLTKEEIAKLDAEEAVFEQILKETQELHTEIFSEEYDYMYDSGVDANKRAIGISPVSEAYIKKMNRKREFLGVSPLDSNGMATSGDSWEKCLEFIKKKNGVK